MQNLLLCKSVHVNAKLNLLTKAKLSIASYKRWSDVLSTSCLFLTLTICFLLRLLEILIIANLYTYLILFASAFALDAQETMICIAAAIYCGLI